MRLREPERGEVLVKVEGCGVCGSSLPVWQGRPWFDYPLEGGMPGHEGWGEVVAVGPGVSRVEVGDRVGTLAQRAFAEYDIAGEGEVERIPERLRDADVPAEPLACVMNIFARSDIRAGQTVVVVGAGFIGLLLIQLSAEHGAHVVAVSRRSSSLDAATKFGAKYTFQSDAAKVHDEVMALTENRGAERVIEAAGSQESLDLASGLVAERGRLIIAGFHQDGPRQVDLQSWNWRGIDIVNAHERDPKQYLAGMRAALAAMERAELRPSGAFSHRFGLSEIQQAFEALENKPDGYLKSLVMVP